MPRIFDNLSPSTKLAPALQETLSISDRADFCVGYFNLRGWGELAPYVDRWNPEDGPCRILIGMQRLPSVELKETLTLRDSPPRMDNATAHRLRVELADQLRQQLAYGLPTNADEAALHRLIEQLKVKRVIVKLFLRHPLHAKLYLLFRDDPNNPITGYLGSSNLTFAGLSQQGELNVDVLDHDATKKLQQWFEDRWNDRFCVDITDELLQIIQESWARQDLVPPYHVYLKMAYHLSNEARAGVEEFKIPSIFGNRLFEFQTAAVKIAAHHLNRRNGVLIGDVVGLGKTLIATAVARIFEDDLGTQTLIICPKNLVRMWEEYRDDYGLRARVLSISRVLSELPNLRRYHQVIIDESHNLRNREGKRYRAIHEYISENESRCILLSATPYNKTYHDLSNQLRLFISEEQDLGIRPEQMLRNMGEMEFRRQHQANPRSLAAFEPTTGVTLCACTWSVAPAALSRTITPKRIPTPGAGSSHSRTATARTFQRGFPKPSDLPSTMLIPTTSTPGCTHRQPWTGLRNCICHAMVSGTTYQTIQLRRRHLRKTTKSRTWLEPASD